MALEAFVRRSSQELADIGLLHDWGSGVLRAAATAAVPPTAPAPTGGAAPPALLSAIPPLVDECMHAYAKAISVSGVLLRAEGRRRPWDGWGIVTAAAADVSVLAHSTESQPKPVLHWFARTATILWILLLLRTT